MAFSNSWIEISRRAFDHNILQCARIVTQKIGCVIKSNAYGHGMREIGILCDKNPRIDKLCVSTLSEALQLRQWNIKKSIFVMAHIDADPASALDAAIELSILSFDDAYALSRVAQRHKKTIDVHIKIDTGLARFGIWYAQAIEEICAIAALEGLNIVGLFTHFAQAQLEDRLFTVLQYERFIHIVDALALKGINPPLIHVANSAGALTYNFDRCTMVRIGAAAYGLWPSSYIKQNVQNKLPDFNLIPVLSWKSRIIHLKGVPSHVPVGYNGTYCTTHESIIAIIPVGYDQGYQLHFSNIAHAMVRDCVVPIIGRICMGYTLLDVSHVSGVSIDDEVTIIGATAPISVECIMQADNRMNVRELTTMINPAIKRIIQEEIDQTKIDIKEQRVHT